MRYVFLVKPCFLLLACSQTNIVLGVSFSSLFVRLPRRFLKVVKKHGLTDLKLNPTQFPCGSFHMAWCVLRGVFPKLHVLFRTPAKGVGGQTRGTTRIDAGERMAHDCQKARAYRPKVESNAVFMWQFSLAWCVLQGIFPKLHVLLRTPVKRVGGQTPGTARIDAGERVVHD